MKHREALPEGMTGYERKVWHDLQNHWEKKSKSRELPQAVRSVVGPPGESAKNAATKAGRAIQRHTPGKVIETTGIVFDAALEPAIRGAVHLLELITEWSAELTNPDAVLEYHRSQKNEIAEIQDLKLVDLEDLDRYTRRMVLRWRTFGAGQGAALGALAMIPYAGGVAAIGLDLVAMHVLSTSVAMRICYSYGFDASDPEMRHLIDRMVLRAYKGQAPKSATIKKANSAFAAGHGRVRWSEKLRDDHRLMVAVENLMKQFSNGRHVPVEKVAKGIPVVAIFAGAGTNAYVLGDVVKQARFFAQTMLLAEKYGLELPSNLAEDVETEPNLD